MSLCGSFGTQKCTRVRKEMPVVWVAATALELLDG